MAVTAERGLGLKKNEIVTVLGGLHGGSKSGKTAAYNDDVGLDDLDDSSGFTSMPELLMAPTSGCR